MPAPLRAEPRAVATSDELRRAALERSAERNARVARRRLAWRWLGWALRASLIWLLPLLLLGAFGWQAWYEHVGAMIPTPEPAAPRATAPRAQSPSLPASGGPLGDP